MSVYNWTIIEAISSRLFGVKDVIDGGCLIMVLSLNLLSYSRYLYC